MRLMSAQQRTSVPPGNPPPVSRPQPDVFPKFRVLAPQGCPEGTSENSPAFQRRGSGSEGSSPAGTAESGLSAHYFSRPEGTLGNTDLVPALKRRAILIMSLSGQNSGNFRKGLVWRDTLGHQAVECRARGVVVSAGILGAFAL